jgi:pimeloyl-ACP methyl ester carboxylesterase
MGRQVIDGIRVEIDASGTGPPLLLVHGLGGPLMWQRVIGPLSADFRVINLHLPGFGESDPSPTPFTTEDAARFLIRVLDELRILRVTLVGISYGGAIAACCASMAAERIERLILINSTGFSAHGCLLKALFRRRVFRLLLSLLLRSERLLCLMGGRSFHNRTNRPAELCKEFSRQLRRAGHREAWIWGMCDVVSGEDGATVSAVRRAAVPTLVLWGKEDRVVKQGAGSWNEELGALAETRVLAGAGHSLPLEVPGELRSAIAGR